MLAAMSTRVRDCNRLARAMTCAFRGRGADGPSGRFVHELRGCNRRVTAAHLVEWQNEVMNAVSGRTTRPVHERLVHPNGKNERSDRIRSGESPNRRDGFPQKLLKSPPKMVAYTVVPGESPSVSANCTALGHHTRATRSADDRRSHFRTVFRSAHGRISNAV
jgi:hypothetical protein